MNSRLVGTGSVSSQTGVGPSPLRSVCTRLWPPVLEELYDCFRLRFKEAELQPTSLPLLG